MGRGGRTLTDDMYSALAARFLQEAVSNGSGTSPRTFRRWLERNSYPTLGDERARRILESLRIAGIRSNTWEGLDKDGNIRQLNQIRLDFKQQEQDIRGAIKEFIDTSITPVEPQSLPPMNNLVGVLSIADIHVGKLAWAAEVGQAYDTKRAVDAYVKAAQKLVGDLHAAGVSRILYIVGNDLIHVDGFANASTKGTPQDMDTRWQYAFRRAKQMVVSVAEELAKFAAIDIVVAPGNHDKVLSWTLGEVVGAYFKDTPGVVVDNSPAHRKYKQYGNLLFGITHGDGLKPIQLPAIMATEVPQQWGQSQYREWLLGHLHRKREFVSTAVDEERGVRMRYLPSLSGIDRWHYEMGYSQQRSAEAHVYDSESGFPLSSYYYFHGGQ